MSDKLVSGVSVNISFGEGEVPSPEKLSAISSQSARAAEQLEKAVGDIHGGSWPYTVASTTTLSPAWNTENDSVTPLTDADERKLDIANLARLIGPASVLNPRTLRQQTSITENVPAGVHEFVTLYPISGVINGSNPSSTDTALTNYVAAEADLLAAGDYIVGSRGRIRCVDVTSGGEITYTTTPEEWMSGTSYNGATFNVMPDPNQISAGGDGCTIGAIDVNGRYTVTTPIITHQQSNIHQNAVALDDKDANFERSMELPRVLINNLSAGDEIPSGFLFLKNETTGEVYEDALYYYNTTTTVKVGNVDLDDAIADGDLFSILTVGTNITMAIDDLRAKQRHSHDGTYGEPPVHINGIIGQYEDEAPSGVYMPSEISGNWFSQYLHRDGYQLALDANVNDNNAMRGPLLLGLAAGTPGSYVGTGLSHALMFSDASVYMRRDSSDNLEVVGAPLQPVDGIVGPEAFTSGTVAIAPIYIYGTWEPGPGWASIVAGTLYTLDIPGTNVEATTWTSVSFAIKPTGNRFIPPRQLETANYNYAVEWNDSGPMVLKVIFDSDNIAEWQALSGSKPYQAVIWHTV